MGLFNARKFSSTSMSDLIASLQNARQKSGREESHVSLRLHQGVACGEIWHMLTGGEALAPELGQRCEYLVLGNAVEECADALVQAVSGTVAVASNSWGFVKDRYYGQALDAGVKRVGQLREGFQPDLPLGRLPSRSEHGSWTFLKRFSHEGARVLQDVVDFAADVRKITVVFMSVHIDVSRPTEDTLRYTHDAFREVQRCTYAHSGTIRQFLQDDSPPPPPSLPY